MKRYLIVVLLLLSSLYLIFFLLREAPVNVEFIIIHQEEAYIEGEYYVGTARNPDLKALFVKQRDKAIKENTRLMIVNYESDTLNGRLMQFIGVMAQSQLRDSTTFRLGKPEGRYLMAALLPSEASHIDPGKIKDKAINFAKENALGLDTSLSYEMYESDGKLSVMFPIR